MAELRFYFDESVELAVSEQLAAGGLDVVSAHSMDLLGDSDSNHLQRAKTLGRVLCTYDTDFLRLAKDIPDHVGIIFAAHSKGSIGGWVHALRALQTRITADEAVGQIIFLSMK